MLFIVFTMSSITSDHDPYHFDSTVQALFSTFMTTPSLRIPLLRMSPTPASTRHIVDDYLHTYFLTSSCLFRYLANFTYYARLHH